MSVERILCKIALVGATSLTIMAIGSPASAQTYTIGVENTAYLPAYSFEDGEYRGYARRMLDAFAQDSGYRFEYRSMPVIRLFASLVAGDIDLKFPDNAYWAQDVKKGQTVIYSQPAVAYIDGVSVLANRKGAAIDTVKTLGIVRGFTAWDWLDRIKNGSVALHENNSFTALLETTLAERNNGAYGNIAVVQYQLRQVLKKPGALVFDPSLPHTRSNYHLSTIKHPDLIRKFDLWLAQNAERLAQWKQELGVDVTM